MQVCIAGIPYVDFSPKRVFYYHQVGLTHSVHQDIHDVHSALRVNQIALHLSNVIVLKEKGDLTTREYLQKYLDRCKARERYI